MEKDKECGIKKVGIVAVSGGFDPLHVGHLEFFQKARALGSKLVVIVNDDEYLLRKKGYFMMSLPDRMRIVKSLRMVDEVIPSIDKDQTVAETLKMLKPDIFANGGDRVIGNSREEATCQEIGCKTVFGLGKKIRSSSDYGMGRTI